MSKKPEYIHYCEEIDKQGNKIISAQEKNSNLFEITIDDGAECQGAYVKFCPLCGDKIKDMAIEPIDDKGITPTKIIIGGISNESKT